ncbi:hypothetical protein PBY51_009054 [Eleginops maclovinus]|uniref:Interferon gamma n=1 Tax=Eleginops maclovinus TaxID=56733 RepID=A0AAN7WXQ6_ELEMC|nr:hypothetical protein PBY51_009054 [Eleginops maclovinus]
MVVLARAVVCLCLCFSLCHVRGNYIPGKMNEIIMNLLQHYNIPESERYNGEPIFVKDSIPRNMEEKKVFMRGVLDAYDSLFNQMLKELPTPIPHTTGSNNLPAVAGGEGGEGKDVRTGLNVLHKMVKDLIKNGYQKHEQLLKSLKNIHHLKMDNRTVQSKALGELVWLYDEASEINDTKRRRRRGSARKGKTHSRG